MLTNFSTVRARLDRMKELEQIDFDDVAGSDRTKKELLMMRREKDKLTKTLGGIRDMAKRYKSTKAEPPFAPTMYGNFHALPSPIAAPTMDNINPILENLSLATLSPLAHLS